MDYSDAVSFLQSFPDMERGTHGARSSTMALDAMKSMLNRMGNPQNGRLTAHVTGSKGKGSTSTMLASILHAAGFKTALYTSPHLHNYTERIALDLKPVSEAEFAGAVEFVTPFVKEEQETGNTISTFGILTAVFFHLAQKAEVDWQIVEVGMGGRFDATNVFEHKELALITAISLEHIEVLGTNQSEIASNKAGIITPGCLVVLGPQKDPAVRSVIGRRASEQGADMIYVPKTYKIKSLSHDSTGQTFSMDAMIGGTMTLHTPLLGEHQVANAASAAASARALADRGQRITEEHIKIGLENARIPGRFEIIERDGGSGAVKNVPIILDGAHNHESAAALAAGLKALFSGKPCIYVVGVNRDKNVNAIWRELLPLSKMVIATQSTNLRAMDPESLAEQLSFQSSLSAVHSKVTKSVGEAVELALSLAEAGDVICVTGSLYVVAEARHHLQPSAGPIDQ
jgi:dihydrofolate synthase/folylpolyglutamate synthase